MLTCPIYHVFYFRSQVVQLFSRITLVVSQCRNQNESNQARSTCVLFKVEGSVFCKDKEHRFLCDSKSYLPL